MRVDAAVGGGAAHLGANDGVRRGDGVHVVVARAVRARVVQPDQVQDGVVGGPVAEVVRVGRHWPPHLRVPLLQDAFGNETDGGGGRFRKTSYR